MLYSNSDKSPEKERKDDAKIGTSQLELTLVSNDREREEVGPAERSSTQRGITFSQCLISKVSCKGHVEALM